MMIFATRYARSIKSSPNYIRKRSFKNFDPSDFIHAIQQVSWLEVYLCTELNQAVKLLSTKITAILDRMAPMKTFQIRNNYCPWLSQLTKDIMLERDRLQKVAAESRNQEDWKTYKKLRNQVNNRLKSEEKTWQRLKLIECGQDSSKLWKTVKGILSWTSSGSPSQLFHDGKLWTRPQEVATVQNEFFLDKVKQIRENLPPPVSDPLAKLKSLMFGRNCSFKLAAVHPDDVDKIIAGLKNSKSFGLDLIDTQVIKLIKAEIVPALTHVINLSIDSQNIGKRPRSFHYTRKKTFLTPKTSGLLLSCLFSPRYLKELYLTRLLSICQRTTSCTPTTMPTEQVTIQPLP